jgi:hypothetical protein
MKLYLRTNAWGRNIVEVHFETEPSLKDWERLLLHVTMITENYRQDEAIEMIAKVSAGKGESSHES